MRTKVVIIICFIFYSSLYLLAQPFSASVSRNPVELDESFELIFTLNGSGKNFQPPSLKDFHVLAGPDQSFSKQVINGSFSQSLSFSFVLRPREAGRFTIGSASVDAGGKKVQSNPIAIEVIPGSQSGAKGGKTSGQEASLSKQIGENLFLRVYANKTQVFSGEQIEVVYKIYSRVNIINYGISKSPSLNGFWSQDIELPQKPQTRQEILDGVSYESAVLKKLILFPQQSGSLTIDPLEVETVVRVRTQKKGRSSWDDFFGNDPFFSDPFGGVQDVRYELKSNSIRIAVRPLPSSGVPPAFTGAVGDFRLQAWMDKTEVPEDESLTLKVKISGTGNLKFLQPVSVSMPPDIESYEPKISDNISFSEGAMSGARTFEYLLVPRHSGEYRIPAVAFPFFNSASKEYRTLTSDEFTIKVAKGNGINRGNVTGNFSKEEIKMLGEDIRFIKTDIRNFREKGRSYFGSPTFFGLLISPVVLFTGFAIFLRKQQKIRGNVVLLRKRSSLKVARKRFRHADQLLRENKHEEFYSEVHSALSGYLSDSLNLPTAELTKEIISGKLAECSIESSLVEDVIRTLELCEAVRFSPVLDSSDRKKVYSDTLGMISQIEEDIR